MKERVVLGVGGLISFSIQGVVGIGRSLGG